MKTLPLSLPYRLRRISLATVSFLLISSTLFAGPARSRRSSEWDELNRRTFGLHSWAFTSGRDSERFAASSNANIFPEALSPSRISDGPYPMAPATFASPYPRADVARTFVTRENAAPLATAASFGNTGTQLTASDGAVSDSFGYSLALSGTTALAGARLDDDKGSNSGSAYVFRNLDTASGTVTQDVKLTASDGARNHFFGGSVAIDGDNFAIGAFFSANGGKGKAYTGSVSSVTTLDEGNASRTIDGISFVSQTDWVVGQTTSGNQVTLTSGDFANVTAAGKAVYVGQNAGSNNNTLVVAGSLTANEIHIGALGNIGNSLLLAGTGDRISDTAAIFLNNGTFSTAGLSETVGVLSVQNFSIIDLGDLSSIVHFDNSAAEAWAGILNIYNWTGSFTGGGMDQLFFGMDASGLTGLQLAEINFYSGAGTGFLGFGEILANGEVVANGAAAPAGVPDSGSTLTLLGGAALLAFVFRQRALAT